MPKYKEYYQQMIDVNRELFDKFSTLDPAVNETEFNEVGRKVQDVIRDYEDRLCGHSESSQYGKFSSTLADKFWDLIRADFPKVDYIGVIS